MNRLTMFIIFVTIASLIYFGLHFVVYKYLNNTLELSKTAQKALLCFFWCSGLSFHIAMILSRFFKIYFLNHYTYIWMGVLAIAFFVVLLSWGVTLLLPTKSRLIAYVALGVIGLISAFSLVTGLQRPRVKHITIPMKNLPAERSGFTIVQVSDLHLEAYKCDGALTHLVETVNGMKPDLVAITGDLVDGDLNHIPHLGEQLKRLKSTHGTFAITGNHEYFSGYKDFLRFAGEYGIRTLRNETVTIDGMLQVVGLEDDEAVRFGNGGPDLEKALSGCDRSKPTVLLYHRPYLFAEARTQGVGLQLAGHTHAGQIPPMDLIVWFFYKYPVGLFEKDGSYIYTSPGTGYWGPPMRFLSRHEITKFTLVSKKKE